MHNEKTPRVLSILKHYKHSNLMKYGKKKYFLFQVEKIEKKSKYNLAYVSRYIGLSWPK